MSRPVGGGADWTPWRPVVCVVCEHSSRGRELWVFDHKQAIKLSLCRQSQFLCFGLGKCSFFFREMSNNESKDSEFESWLEMQMDQRVNWGEGILAAVWIYIYACFCMFSMKKPGRAHLTGAFCCCCSQPCVSEDNALFLYFCHYWMKAIVFYWGIEVAWSLPASCSSFSINFSCKL